MSVSKYLTKEQKAEISRQNGRKTKTHGLSKSRPYHIFVGIKMRCFKPTNHLFYLYGARGISCEWNSFEEFYEDIGKYYSPGLSIDRINVNGNYSKENCRWATPKEQMRNKRNNFYLEIDGTKKLLIDWCAEYKKDITTVKNRLQRGWTQKDALLRPVDSSKRNPKYNYLYI